jgi:hypothetical protein
MDIKAGIVKTAFKQKTSFFNKAEILTKREIGECIVNKQ